MGRGKGERRRFASPLSLSRGPSRFKLVTSLTCFALALTSLEASEEEAVVEQYAQFSLEIVFR